MNLSYLKIKFVIRKNEIFLLLIENSGCSCFPNRSCGFLPPHHNNPCSSNFPFNFSWLAQNFFSMSRESF